MGEFRVLNKCGLHVGMSFAALVVNGGCSGRQGYSEAELAVDYRTSLWLTAVRYFAINSHTHVDGSR